MANTFFFILIISLVSISLYASPVTRPGFRVSLTHVDAGQNFTTLQLLHRAINRAKPRVKNLQLSSMAANAGANGSVRAPVHPGEGEFFMNLSIGTPAAPFSAIMDTGSDLIWTQCKPCTHCYQQPTPIFDPAQSSSFSKTPCDSELCKGMSNSKCGNNGCQYLYTYGDDSSTDGFLATETFTFGESAADRISVPGIDFGCGLDNQGKGLNQGAGLVGLGRGPLSLVSQLGEQKFSYCLTSINGDKTSSLLFGSPADRNLSAGASHGTPLIQNPIIPTFYYLSLEGITVGETLLPIPKSLFELGTDGNGGLIIDSGTTITQLQEDAFDVVKQEFISQIELRVADSESVGLDLCFDLPSESDNKKVAQIPKLVFHFKGLDLELPSENYMVKDSETGLMCLAMAATGSLSILGNFQQQNMLVVHDLDKEIVSFIPTRCDQL